MWERSHLRTLLICIQFTCFTSTAVHILTREELGVFVSLWELDHLRTLNLDHNQIDEIPGDVAKLSSLTKLRLDANNLDSIPPQV